MPSRQTVEIDGKELALSNPDKILFPASGFTKGQVIAFYSQIADTILPHLRGRPLTLKRYPDGVTKPPFYEKNAPAHRPDWVKTVPVPRSEGGPDINYVLCNDRATLLWATNLGDIEKHTFLARTPKLNCPTALVFDLDPGAPADIIDCCHVALALRSLFETWGLQSFVKVSGSKGLHLAVPLNMSTSYEVTQPFAKALAQLVTAQHPERVVFDMAKALRKGKVLIDWSQNSDFKTTVCAYAMRAREDGPFISMPVTWDEIGRAAKSKKSVGLFFTPDQAVKRILKLGDLFQPVLSVRQKLPSSFLSAVADSPAPRLTGWQRNLGKVRDKTLKEYASKRDHSKTKEPPAPKVKRSGKAAPLRFVIQKHDASHLHYDWRLEMDGVLRSWAVPKGPPVGLREARLAVHVEDHPLEYASFEGTIPAGSYGAGTVMVWDHGEYEDMSGNASEAFRSGKMHLMLRGEKLQGEWILVKDKRDAEGNRWLLIKAGEAMKKLSMKRDDTSVLSGRSMKAISAGKKAPGEGSPPKSPLPTPQDKLLKAGAKRSTPPRYLEVMRCKPVTALPVGDGWSFELKFDGFRCLALKIGSKVAMFSRNHKSLNARFPELVSALEALPGNFSLDGEIVALDEKGKPSFELLQNTRNTAYPTAYYAFDLLNLADGDLTACSWQERRSRLEKLSEAFVEPVRLSALLPGRPEQVLSAVKSLELEGVVGKKHSSVYQAGERSGSWVKCRVNQEQEFVIGGFVPGSKGFARLLLGVYVGRKLRYVGKLPNGFVDRTRSEIFPKLDALRIAECPFENLPEPEEASRWGEAMGIEKMKECVWVKPKLVCQVGFVEWTGGGKLRHPTFVAMREDKRPASVVRET